MPKSISPTNPHKKINREKGNRLDKERRYLHRRTRALDFPHIKVKNLLSSRSERRVINPSRTGREELEGRQTNNN